MPRGNPRIQLRLKPETINWLKDYAQHNNTTMSEIIREYIETLKRKDKKERALIIT
jgi:predicted DNA-binding protein